MLALEDVRSFSEPSMYLPDHASAFGGSTRISVSDLGNHLTKVLTIQGDQESTQGLFPSFEKNDINIAKEDHHEGTPDGESGNLGCKCLRKSATFPCPGESHLSVDGEKDYKDDVAAQVDGSSGYVQSANQPYPRSMSLPTTLKLISAMKGSREKQGKQPVKLTVTWAPDVYDPPPSSVSHVPTNKGQRHRNDGKKKWKNKQKGNGKSSRGRGKDKKPARKNIGSSKSLDSNDIAVVSSELQASILDYDIGSPDPFCGSSFLKKSVTKMHFPVAEAT